MSDERRLAHLHMIQGVVTRMAQNSFLLKGWTVTLMAGLFSVAAASDQAALAYVALIPVVVFWALDGYFLRQERLFRKLYDDVRSRPADAIDYGMSTAPFAGQVASVPGVMLSRTLATLYGALIVTTVVVAVVASS